MGGKNVEFKKCFCVNFMRNTNLKRDNLARRCLTICTVKQISIKATYCLIDKFVYYCLIINRFRLIPIRKTEE